MLTLKWIIGAIITLEWIIGVEYISNKTHVCYEACEYVFYFLTICERHTTYITYFDMYQNLSSFCDESLLVHRISYEKIY